MLIKRFLPTSSCLDKIASQVLKTGAQKYSFQVIFDNVRLSQNLIEKVKFSIL